MREPGGYSSNKRVEDLSPPPRRSARRTPMLTDEERDRIAETLTDEPFTGPDHPMWAEVESIVRAARAQERQQVIDELREFLPEWNYPPHVIAAICLELKDRLPESYDRTTEDTDG